MIVSVDAERLKRFLEVSQDAEEVGANEYAVDLYDVSTPISMNIAFTKKGVDVLAALLLLYNEALDGWYLGDKVKDEALLSGLLNEALAGAD